MWLLMEALAPGQAGPRVVIMMEAAPGHVCVEHEPAIAPPLSVVEIIATASAWRSPTAPGTFFVDALIYKYILSLSTLYEYVCTL